MHKVFKQILISSLSGLLIYTFLGYSITSQLPEWGKFYIEILGFLLAANVIGWLSRLWFKGLNKLLPWEKRTAFRFLVQEFSVTAVSIILLLGSYILMNWLEINTIIKFFPWATDNDTFLKLSILVFLAVFIFTIVDFTLYSYNQYAVVRIEAIRQDRKQLELQFDALKSQLSPHYLFNSLNTISSLVYKDVTQAETFIRRLAQTYQYILSTDNKKLISVAEEIEFVKAYNYLLRVRFEEALQLNIDVSPNLLNSKVPPLTLQILVENAVKHNVVSIENPLEIRITSDQDRCLKVINNRTTQQDIQSSFKIGLENIKKRYRYFTELPIKIVNEEWFEVQLPIIGLNGTQQ